MPRRTVLALPLAIAALAGCRREAVRPVDVEPAWERESPVRPLPERPLGMEVDFGAARGVEVTPEKVRLGRWLFFDARLSADGTVSCGTCHRPALAFSEDTARSTGIRGQQGTRKSPPIVNAAFSVFGDLFWDGRAASLQEQVKGPIANPVEMGNTHEGAARTVAGIAGYRKAFREAYADERIDIDRIADAIAAYEATRLSGGSAWDRFTAGEAAALSDEAREGMDLFFGRGRCNACHLGPNLTDGRFHNIGIGYDEEAPPPRSGFSDPGRYAVTGEPDDTGAFKTPTLRDVARRAPYMHDGSVPTLAEAVMTYVRIESNPWLDPAMLEVRLAPFDVRPLVAFLEALDGTGFEDTPPASFPR
ncbi:MAG TPA: cytochrome c peroxidase [Anaeromyxobacteraceae bacterium]|nr:cytochrome c peroxidase [Anaeromyxobacteraceae bacterium]